MSDPLPLYEIFMVYGHIYLYGHNTIVHTCLYWYNSMTMRQKEKKNDRRKRIQGRDLSWLQMAVSSRSPLTHLCVFSILLLFSILFHYFDHGFALPRWTRRIHFADDRAADINNYSL